MDSSGCADDSYSISRLPIEIQTKKGWPVCCALSLLYILSSRDVGGELFVLAEREKSTGEVVRVGALTPTLGYISGSRYNTSKCRTRRMGISFTFMQPPPPNPWLLKLRVFLRLPPPLNAALVIPEMTSQWHVACLPGAGHNNLVRPGTFKSLQVLHLDRKIFVSKEALDIIVNNNVHLSRPLADPCLCDPANISLPGR